MICESMLSVSQDGLLREMLPVSKYRLQIFDYTGCLKKNATEIQQAVVHHKLNKTIQVLHRTKELLFSFSMIYFLNRNDEKWPHTRQIKIAGRNHILPPLGIAWKTKHKQFPRGN